jgi:hypothetical protein
MIGGFFRRYAEARQRPSPDWQERAAHLVLLLMLARVDGKSPVEYLDEGHSHWIRNFVRDELRKGSRTLAALAEVYFDAIRALPPRAK